MKRAKLWWRVFWVLFAAWLPVMGYAVQVVSPLAPKKIGGRYCMIRNGFPVVYIERKEWVWHDTIPPGPENGKFYFYKEIKGGSYNPHAVRMSWVLPDGQSIKVCDWIEPLKEHIFHDH